MQHEQTVTIVSTTITVDQYGDMTTETVNTDVERCLVAPRSSTERSSPRSPAVLSGVTVYMPPGTVLDPDDDLIIDGRKFSVEGDPGDWGAGLEVAANRWEQ